jgi:hypothetical protein
MTPEQLAKQHKKIALRMARMEHLIIRNLHRYRVVINDETKAAQRLREGLTHSFSYVVFQASKLGKSLYRTHSEFYEPRRFDGESDTSLFLRIGFGYAAQEGSDSRMAKKFAAATEVLGEVAKGNLAISLEGLTAH